MRNQSQCMCCRLFPWTQYKQPSLCLDLGRTHWRSAKFAKKKKKKQSYVHFLLIKIQGKIRDDDSNPSLSWEHSS